MRRPDGIPGADAERGGGSWAGRLRQPPELFLVKIKIKCAVQAVGRPLAQRGGALCCVMVVIQGRMLCAAGCHERVVPPATSAVSGQSQSSICGKCCGKVTCKRGVHLHAVLVIFRGRTLSSSAAGKAEGLNGAAGLPQASPSRTRL